MGSYFCITKKMRCKASHSVGTDDHEQRESQARSMRPDWRVKGSPRDAWVQPRCRKSLNILIKEQQPLLLLFGASSGTRRKPEASVIESMQVYLQKRTSTLNKRCFRTTVRCTHDTACLVRLLCPLRTISANATRVRRSLLAVILACQGFATQRVVATTLQKVPEYTHKKNNSHCCCCLVRPQGLDPWTH